MGHLALARVIGAKTGAQARAMRPQSTANVWGTRTRSNSFVVNAAERNDMHRGRVLNACFACSERCFAVKSPPRTHLTNVCQRESAVLTSRDGSGRFYQVSPVL